MIAFTKKNMNSLPYELVDIIADYHDYDKYCKPAHIEKLKEVINDIGDMASIMEVNNHTISANLAWQCWGPGAKHWNMVGLYDDDYEADMAHFDYEGSGWYN